MTYTPYVDEVFPIFIYYIILIVFSILISIMMYKKYSERKTKATLYMSIVYTIATITLIVITIGLGEAIITRYFKEIYRFTFPLGYALLVCTSIIYMFFAGSVTDSKIYRKAKIPLIIIGLIVIVLLYLPTNYWGVPQEDYAGKLNTRLIVTIFLVVYNAFVYIIMARIYYLANHITTDPIARFGFKLLYYSIICMVIFLLCVIMDTLFIILLHHPGYSIFMYLAWLFVISFFVLSYLSLIMPQWVEKRIKK